MSHDPAWRHNSDILCTLHKKGWKTDQNADSWNYMHHYQVQHIRQEQYIKLRSACSVCIQILVMTDHNTEASEYIMWYGHISLHIYVIYKLASAVTVMHRCKPLKLCTVLQSTETTAPATASPGHMFLRDCQDWPQRPPSAQALGLHSWAVSPTSLWQKATLLISQELSLKQIQLGYVAIKDLIRVLWRMWSRLQNYQGVNEMSPASGWKSTASLGPSTMSVTPVIW